MADGVAFPLLALSRLRMGTDGKGVTTLVAGAGCPLRCRWCLNKRLLAEKPPEWVSPEELFARTRIDDLYFQATGGGLCFGGGEALLHTDFIAAFRELTGGAWKLSAETSLHVAESALAVALTCVDEFIVDVKSMDADIYSAYTGGDNGLVLRNLQTLSRAVPPENVKVRVPLIPQYNDETDRQNSEALLRELGFTRIELFDYVIREDSAAL
ncbi:MAG: radical SAM protein [Clostridia bacterium]|nr:radical SAM protein [Clostridia bacterium]